jgi:tetratricopeptide (TPR) repeat protein
MTRVVLAQFDGGGGIALVWVVIYLLRRFVFDTPNDPDHAGYAVSAAENLARLGQFEKAEEALRKLVKRSARTWGQNSIYVAIHLRELAFVWARGGKWREARAEMKRSLAIEEQILGPGSPDLISTMDWLVSQPEAQENDKVFNRELLQRAASISAATWGTQSFEYGSSLNRYMLLLLRQGDLAEAERIGRFALQVMENFREKYPTWLATILSNVACVVREKPECAVEAEDLFRRALAIWDEPANSNHPNALETLEGLARLVYKRGALKEAEELLRQKLTRCEQQTTPDGRELVHPLLDLAHVLRAEEKLPEAIECFKRAEDLQVQFEQGQPGLAQILEQRAILHGRLGEFSEALPLMRRALTLRKSVLPATSALIPVSMCNLASLLLQMGEWGEAETISREGLEFAEKGDDDELKAACLYNLAIALKSKGDLQGAEALLWRESALYEKLSGMENLRSAASLEEIAWLQQSQGNAEGAEALLRQVLAIREKLLRPNDPLLATTLIHVAGMETKRGSTVERESMLRRALLIYEQAQGSESRHVGATLSLLGRLLHGSGRYDEAEQILRRSLAIAESSSGAEHGETAIAMARLGALLEDKGDLTGGRLLMPRALAIATRQFGANHSLAAELRERLNANAMRTSASHVN